MKDLSKIKVVSPKWKDQVLIIILKILTIAIIQNNLLIPWKGQKLYKIEIVKKTQQKN
jgi:hypothetical protein